MKYVGPNKVIRGRTAIVRDPVISKGEPEGMVMAQFDFLPEWESENRRDPTHTTGFRTDFYGYLCLGWHPFQKEDFEETKTADTN